MHDIVDLRSDTLTLPTPEMREAMARAEVGDDVWERGSRPSSGWRRWRPSGWARRPGSSSPPAPWATSSRSWRRRQTGQEVVLDLDSHIFNYEVAGAAVVGDVQMRPGQDGARVPHARPGARGAAAREHPPPADRPRLPREHAQPPRRHLLHAGGDRRGRRGRPRRRRPGAPRRRSALQRRGRAQARPRRDFARHVDSVTFCVSKGLGAPVGSVVCGSRDVRRAAPARPQDAGRRHAAGRRHRGGRHRRARAHGRPPRRGSRQRARAGRGRRASCRAWPSISPACRRTSSSSGSSAATAASAAATAELVQGCAARKVKIHAIGPDLDPVRDPQGRRRRGHRAGARRFREITARW